MCGINLLFSYNGSSQGVDRLELSRTRKHMFQRGPDGGGEWISSNGRVGLGHQRLSIIDLSDNGAQPMQIANGSGSIVITFNGEIYNYSLIKTELIERGYTFSSGSDTEVLLRLYEADGVDMLSALRGMFSFAIWDSKLDAMLIARDPFGIKPLYYSDDGSVFRAASQVKALVAGGAISNEVDLAAQAGFYLFGSVPEPLTMYKDIKALPAGSYKWISRDGQCEAVTYFSVAKTFSEAASIGYQYGKIEAAEIITKAVKDTVDRHLVSDVSVGAFLSSGIDSNVIVDFANRGSVSALQTLTMSSAEHQGTPMDESLLARKIAEKHGGIHSEHLFSFDEFNSGMGLFLDAMDQPSIDGVNSYFVAKAASALGWKVALSGVGGDEIFGGYPSFSRIPFIVKYMQLLKEDNYLSSFLSFAVKGLGKYRSISPKLSGLAQYGATYSGAYLLQRGLFLPEELGQIMGVDEAREGLELLQPLRLISDCLDTESKHSNANVSILESSMYMKNQLLRDMDWASMSHSLEVRTPFVDSHFLKAVAPLALTKQKSCDKELLLNSCSAPVRRILKSRAKSGFNVPLGHFINKLDDYDNWKGIECLRGPNVASSRRWSFVVMSKYLQGMV
jgi:asparagine synthase (glutamine-hydrolysing)